MPMGATIGVPASAFEEGSVVVPAILFLMFSSHGKGKACGSPRATRRETEKAARGAVMERAKGERVRSRSACSIFFFFSKC